MIEAMRKPRGGFPVAMAVVEQRWSETIVHKAGLNVHRLNQRGINIANLAVCLHHGLVVEDELLETIERLSPDDFNGALEHLMDRIPAIEAHPTSILDQCLHMNDRFSPDHMCSCGVDTL